MIAAASRPALRHIVENLRPRDREEAAAILWADADTETSVEHIAASSFCVTAHAADGEPVAYAGARPDWPGVWTVFAMGTPRWPETALELTRYVRRTMIPCLVDLGAHRAQCYSMADYGDAHRWIETLGAKREAVLRRFGRDQQDFVLFRWLATELTDVQRPKTRHERARGRAATAA